MQEKRLDWIRFSLTLKLSSRALRTAIYPGNKSARDPRLRGAVVQGVDEVAQSELRKRWAEGDKLVMRADAEATAAEMGGAGPSMQFLEE